MSDINQVTLSGKLLQPPRIFTYGQGSSGMNFVINVEAGGYNGQPPIMTPVEINVFDANTQNQLNNANIGQQIVVQGRVGGRQFSRQDQSTGYAVSIKCDRLIVVGGVVGALQPSPQPQPQPVQQTPPPAPQTTPDAIQTERINIDDVPF